MDAGRGETSLTYFEMGTLAAFWLFPRFASPLWGVPERALSKPGLGDEMSPGGWLRKKESSVGFPRVPPSGPRCRWQRARTMPEN